MSRFDEALARFTAAIDQLETRIEERLTLERDSSNSAAELGLLKAERERMFARIAALEEEARTLAGLTEEVEDRLDGAITEIREVLGRN